MKIRKRIRARVATVLAAVMAITMAAPALPVYALDYGDPSVIRFDPGLGPDLMAQDDSHVFYSMNGSNHGYGNLPQVTEGGKKISYATGQAGHALTESADFTGIETQEAQHDGGNGTIQRPVLPDFDTDAVSAKWPGYEFQGWFDKDDRKLLNLPAHFGYTSPTTYTAKWTGDSSQSFQFTVMHYRDLDTTRNGQTDAAAIIADAAAQNIHAFEIGGTDWSTSMTANQAVSATYRRDIPGYTLQDVLIKNNKKRRFGEVSGAGTIEPAAASLNGSHNLIGVMPNDNLTVAYRYKPNENQRFPFRVEYVNAATNAQIKVPESVGYAAETEVSKTPEAISAYAFQEAEWVTGNTADADRGIYAASENGCTLDTTTGAFSGKMPNQAVTIRYKYVLDDTFTSKVIVNYRDNHGNLMTDIGNNGVDKLDLYFGENHVSVPKKNGYSYPPNIAVSPNANFTDQQSPTETDQNFGFELQNGGGTIDVTYTEDLNDSNYWARVTYASGEHGEISGTTEPKSFRKGAQELSDLTAGITEDADQNYAFKGWYKANAAGEPTGDALSGNINLDGDLRLVAVFEENPADWFDLSFVAGSHGSVSGVLTAHVARGTTWDDLSLPSAVPSDSTYTFTHWYNEAGEPMTDADALILANQTYTARFTRTGSVDDGILTIPDVSGSVESNGSGTVTVNAPNEDRKYALTDKDGKVIAVKTGTALQSGGFTGLPICEQYFVYELEVHQNPAQTSSILTLDPDMRSQPALAVVPALGNNYSVSDDPAATEKKKITVTPAAADTVYALLDADGNVVAQEGSADGWKEPSGSPGSVEFTGLDPNTTYTVVARTSGNGTPEEKQPMGSTIAVAGSQTSAGSAYMLRLLDGGRVTEITRNGAVIAIGDDDTELLVREGDRIKIDADAADADGNAFRQWNVLIGSVTIPHRNRRNQSITMPRGAVVLQATYDTPAAAPASNATLDYAPKDGRFALNPEGDAVETLRTALIDNPTDQDALAQNKEIAYTVHFNRRSVAASVSNAIKEQTGEEALKFPWSVVINLTRAVDGVNKPLATGSNAEVNVLAKIDESLLGGMDYRLFRQKTDAAGDPVFEDIQMEPNPNEEDSGFAGVFHFLANIGDTVILSYSKAYIVTITDTKRGTVHTLKVREGESLEDADNYMDVRGDLDTGWTDPATGIEYELEGIKKTNSASAPLYDVTDEVTRNLTLYALYVPADDSAWQEAHDKLANEISIANALSLDGNVSPEDRQTLADAVDDALAVLNRLPRPTTAELEAAYGALKAIVDGITTGTPTPPTPTPPGPTPPRPNNNGGGSGGSGGSGGGGGGGSSRGISASGGPGAKAVYHSGTDGNWENFDPAGHGWAFVTTAGKRLKDQWADIVYTFGGVSKTYSYHFDADGVMDSGWYKDAAGNWYFLSTVHDGWFGGLIKGWHHDADDGRWYYLNLLDGAMKTGWQKIDGKWYFLNPHTPEQTWFWNDDMERWEYGNGQSRPLGSMYESEMTPDGYQVDENGEWIRETP